MFSWFSCHWRSRPYFVPFNVALHNVLDSPINVSVNFAIAIAFGIPSAPCMRRYNPVYTAIEAMLELAPTH